MIEIFNAVFLILSGPIVLGVATTFALSGRPVWAGIYVGVGVLALTRVAIELAAL